MFLELIQRKIIILKKNESTELKKTVTLWQVKLVSRNCAIRFLEFSTYLNLQRNACMPEVLVVYSSTYRENNGSEEIPGVMKAARWVGRIDSSATCV